MNVNYLLSKWVLLQIILSSCLILLKPRSQVKSGRSLSLASRESFRYENKLGDPMIKQILNVVIIRKYSDVSVVSRLIICQSQRLRQIDLLASYNAQYFAQPCVGIVNC